MTYVKGRNKRVFQVLDSVGESMVATGHVKRATESEYRKQRKAAAVPTDDHTESESTETDEEAHTDEQDTAEQTPEAVVGNPEAEKPAGNSSTEAWWDYALALGYSEEQLVGLGRDEIKSLVG